MILPTIPFRSGQSWAGQATGSRLDAGYYTVSFSNDTRRRSDEGKGSNNEICEAGFPLLHCDFILHQTANKWINHSKPTTRCFQVAPHGGWLIYDSNLLLTSFDTHEMIKPSSPPPRRLPFCTLAGAPSLWPPSRCAPLSVPISMLEISCSFLWTPGRAGYGGFSIFLIVFLGFMFKTDDSVLFLPWKTTTQQSGAQYFLSSLFCGSVWTHF